MAQSRYENEMSDLEAENATQTYPVTPYWEKQEKSFKKVVEKMSDMQAKAALMWLAIQLDQGEMPTVFDLVDLFDQE